MAKPIHAQYLNAVSQLERSYLLAYDEGIPSKTSNWDVIYRQFDDLKAIYKQVSKPLEGRDLQEIKKAHAQIKLVFPLRKPGESRTYDADAKQLHYLRIALEHDLSKLVPKYFTQLTYESQSLAFELLCTNLGCTSGDKVRDGKVHIAKNPLNLLSPIFSIENAPRIIDVLLQGKTPTPTPKEKKKLIPQEASPQPTQQTFGMEQLLDACCEIENSFDSKKKEPSEEDQR